MYMELGSECSVSDPETDTRCAGPGDRIVPIASATRASHRISPVIASINHGPRRTRKMQLAWQKMLNRRGRRGRRHMLTHQ